MSEQRPRKPKQNSDRDRQRRDRQTRDRQHIGDRRPKDDGNRSEEMAPAGGERLQKVLASAGLAGRRECEEWIVQGRVEVDGETVTELGTRVDPMTQQIRVDGVALPKPRREYYLLNKPVNVLCTNFDPAGRPRAIDLIQSRERLFTVGRLDRSSEGLILITNDGELANRLMHPRYEVEKTYLVRVAGLPSDEVLARLRKGIHLAEGFARVSSLIVRRRHHLSTDMEIVLKEGKNREIRRILARVGHKVLTLKRIAFGPLRLATLPIGASRKLTSHELEELRAASAESGRESRRRERDSKRPPKAEKPSSDSSKAPPSAKPATPQRSEKLASAKQEGEGSVTPSWPNKAKQSTGPSKPPMTKKSIDSNVADWEAELMDEVEVPLTKSGPFVGTVVGMDEEAGTPPIQRRSTKRSETGSRDASRVRQKPRRPRTEQREGRPTREARVDRETRGESIGESRGESRGDREARGNRRNQSGGGRTEGRFGEKRGKKRFDGKGGRRKK